MSGSIMHKRHKHNHEYIIGRQRQQQRRQYDNETMNVAMR